MTTVRYDPVHLSLEISGHAEQIEFKEDGQIGYSMACCGVSTLAFTLKQVLENRPDFKGNTKINDTVPSFYFEAKPKITACLECECVFDTIVTGIELLAVEFPDSFKIIREKGALD